MIYCQNDKWKRYYYKSFFQTKNKDEYAHTNETLSSLFFFIFLGMHTLQMVVIAYIYTYTQETFAYISNRSFFNNYFSSWLLLQK